MLLDVQALTVQFGGLTAVNNVSFQAHGGEILGLIGPNGAGKTTVFNALTGYVDATAGVISLEGRAVTRMPTWQRAKAGMARTFQNLRLFPELTVAQTVLIGTHGLRKSNVIADLIGTRLAKAEEQQCRETARQELAFVGMLDYANVPVKNLAYGHRRRVEIARALASQPKLLLLDEPAAGMNPQECADLVGMIRNIRKRGFSVLLVEHHMAVVMELCDRIVVLDHGVKIAEGLPAEIRTNQQVIEAYLGKGGGRKRRARAQTS